MNENDYDYEKNRDSEYDSYDFHAKCSECERVFLECECFCPNCQELENECVCMNVCEECELEVNNCECQHDEDQHGTF